MKENVLTFEDKKNLFLMIIPAFRERKNRSVDFLQFSKLHLSLYLNLFINKKVPCLIPSKKEATILSVLRDERLSNLEIKIHKGVIKSTHETMHFDVVNHKVAHLINRFSKGKVTVQKRNDKTSHIQVVLKNEL